MSTNNQSLKSKNKKFRKYHKNRVPALRGCPQKRGVCLNIFKEKPKKPNSAKRSITKVRLSTRKTIRVQIPGEKHKLMKFNRVLIRGGRTRDLPGVRYRIIRGKYDSTPILERRKAISKYGLKSTLLIELLKRELSK